MLVAVVANTAQWLAGVGSIVAASLLLIGIVFVGWQLMRSVRTRQGQLLSDLSRRWEEPALTAARSRQARMDTEARNRLVDRAWKAGSPASKERGEAMAVPDFFEMLGALEHDHALSIRLVNQLWGPVVTATWAQWQPAVRRIRAITDDDSLYGNFERLDRRVHQRREFEAWVFRSAE